MSTNIPNSDALLLYQVGPVRCCAPSQTVLAVIEPPALTRTPGSSDRRPGIFSHNGNIVTVTDLRVCFGVSQPRRRIPGHLIVVDLQDRVTGFWVDNIHNVIDWPRGGWGALPALLPRGVFKRTLQLHGHIHLYSEFSQLDQLHADGYLRDYIEHLQQKDDTSRQSTKSPTRSSSHTASKQVNHVAQAGRKTAETHAKVNTKPDNTPPSVDATRAPSRQSEQPGVGRKKHVHIPVAKPSPKSSSDQAAKSTLQPASRTSNMAMKTADSVASEARSLQNSPACQANVSRRDASGRVSTAATTRTETKPTAGKQISPRQHVPDAVHRPRTLANRTASSTASVRTQRTSSAGDLSQPSANLSPRTTNITHERSATDNGHNRIGLLVLLLAITGLVAGIGYQLAMDNFSPRLDTRRTFESPSPTLARPAGTTPAVTRSPSVSSRHEQATPLRETLDSEATFFNAQNETDADLNTTKSIESNLGSTTTHSTSDTGLSMQAVPVPAVSATPAPSVASQDPYQAEIQRDESGITIVLSTPQDVVAIKNKPEPRNPAEISGLAQSQNDTKESPAEPPAPTAAEPQWVKREIIHLVVKGDTLWHIAKRYVNNPFRYPDLARLSNIKNPDLIYPGDRVRIIHSLPSQPIETGNP